MIIKGSGGSEIMDLLCPRDIAKRASPSSFSSANNPPVSWPPLSCRASSPQRTPTGAPPPPVPSPVMGCSHLHTPTAGILAPSSTCDKHCTIIYTIHGTPEIYRTLSVLKLHDVYNYSLLWFICFAMNDGPKLFKEYYELHLWLQNDHTRNSRFNLPSVRFTVERNFYFSKYKMF